MGGPASINRVELYSTHDFQAQGYFCDFQMLVCTTSVTGLSTGFEANYDGNIPVPVMARDTLHIDWSSTTPGWNGFDFDTPFEYGGSGNLILEFRYMGSSGTTVNARAMSYPTGERCLDGGYPSCPVGENMVFLTCMRIHYGTAGIHGADPGTGPLLRPRENPCGGTVLMELLLPEAGAVSLRVLDISGRTVLSPITGEYLQAGASAIPVDLSSLPEGMYAVMAECGGRRTCCSIIRI